MEIIKAHINEIADLLGVIKEEEVVLRERLKELKQEKDLAKKIILENGGKLIGDFFTASVKSRFTSAVDFSSLKYYVERSYPHMLALATLRKHADVLTVKPLSDEVIIGNFATLT